MSGLWILAWGGVCILGVTLFLAQVARSISQMEASVQALESKEAAATEERRSRDAQKPGTTQTAKAA